MILEHRTKKVISNISFAKRLAKYLSFALGLISVSVGIVLLGYHYLAGLGWLDSFHMSCMILTRSSLVVEMPTDAAKL